MLFGVYRRSASGRAFRVGDTFARVRNGAHPARLADVPGAGGPRPRHVRRADRARARERGHEIELAVLERARRRQAPLPGARAARRGSAERPDVVYAHFLVPCGLIASRVDAPLVVTAHGRDVRNIGAIPGVAAAHTSRRDARVDRDRASPTTCAASWRRSCRRRAARREVVDSGVDLERFSPSQREGHLDSPALPLRRRADERKNVVRLADAFARLGEGSLTFVGDGPLRPQLEGRERVRLVGRVPHEEVPGWIASADVVCQPSLIEPLGQSLLEAMAGAPLGRRDADRRPARVRSTRSRCARRSNRPRCARARASRGRVVAASERGRARGRRRARRQASGSADRGDSRASRSRSASLSSTSGLTCVLEPGLSRHLERLQERLARLLRGDALFQPVVASDEQLPDLFAG